MPIFVHGSEKDKLTILYFIRSFSEGITQEQLYHAIYTCGCMEYFAYSQAISELEEDGYLAVVPCSFGQCYHLSAQGSDTLEMFQKSLPISLRKELDEYVQLNRDAIRREMQIVTGMEELKGGGYLVTLTVAEKTNLVLEIKLSLSSKEQALTMRANWEEHCSDLYDHIWDTLLTSKNATPKEETP